MNKNIFRKVLNGQRLSKNNLNNQNQLDFLLVHVNWQFLIFVLKMTKKYKKSVLADQPKC